MEWSSKARHFDYAQLGEMDSASQILDRNGELLGRIGIENRDPKPLSELSPYLSKAAIAGEDARFFEHGGVDYYGLARAVTRNLQKWVGFGNKKEGGSTLTMQLARNTWREELPPEDRTVRRKLLEMFVAWEIERQFPKKDILTHYLNRVYFGAGFWGAESAAQGYFRKPAKELTLGESALLIGLLRRPEEFSPWRNRRACIKARDWVLFRMRELQFITEAEYRTALAEDPLIRNKRANQASNYLLNMVTKSLAEAKLSDGALSEGYRIYTTIDLSLQRKAEAALEKQLLAIEERPDFRAPHTYGQFEQTYRQWKRTQTGASDDPAPKAEYLQGALVALDNESGAIRALVGGRNAQHSELNRATQVQRPPGSAFFPLVYATAFEKGLHPGTAVQDAILDNRQVMIGGTTGWIGEWSQESTKLDLEGPIPARTALIKSKNAATFHLGKMIAADWKQSIEAVAALSKTAGIESKLRPFPATFLGISEVTPLELTLAYTSIPGGGSRPKAPFIVEKVESKHGKVLLRKHSERTHVFSVGVAYQVHDCLAAALNEGTGARAFSSFGLRRMPVAGKTGTAHNYTDAWFVGYSSALTCSVWIGFDQQRNKPRAPIFDRAFGGDLALPVWSAFMNESATAFPPRPFVRPAELRPCSVCSKSGFRPLPLCQEPNPSGQSASTAMEVWLTEAQRPGPDELCDFHGPKRPRKRHYEDENTPPRAEAVFDPGSLTPIRLQSPTVIGSDPFGSDKAEENAIAVKKFKATSTTATLENTVSDPAPPRQDAPTIPRAVPVTPAESLPPPVKPTKPSNLPKLEF
jgi:penicillin-binding protein 1A